MDPQLQALIDKGVALKMSDEDITGLVEQYKARHVASAPPSFATKGMAAEDNPSAPFSAGDEMHKVVQSMPPGKSMADAARQVSNVEGEHFRQGADAQLADTKAHPVKKAVQIGAAAVPGMLFGAVSKYGTPGAAKIASTASELLGRPTTGAVIGAAHGYYTGGIPNAMLEAALGAVGSSTLQQRVGRYNNKFNPTETPPPSVDEQLGVSGPDATSARSAATVENPNAPIPQRVRPQVPPAQTDTATQMGLNDPVADAARSRASEAPSGPKATQVDSNNRPPTLRPIDRPTTKAPQMSGPKPAERMTGPMPRAFKAKAKAEADFDSPAAAEARERNNPVQPRKNPTDWRSKSKSARNDPDGYSVEDHRVYDKLKAEHPEMTGSELHEAVVKASKSRSAPNYADKKAEAAVRARPTAAQEAAASQFSHHTPMPSNGVMRSEALPQPSRFDRMPQQVQADEAFEALMDQVHGPDWRPQGNGQHKGK